MKINFTSIKKSTDELSHRLPEFTAEDYRAMFRACDYLKDLSDGLYKAHENITALANARVAGGMQ